MSTHSNLRPSSVGFLHSGSAAAAVEEGHHTSASSALASLGPRSNETHASTTDPEAKLSKKGKGKEAKLAYTGNVMTENRNGFVVEAELRQASGMVERETAKDMVVRYSPGAKRLTVGADKGFDTVDFVADMRDFNVTPHVAQNTTNRLSAIDHRTTRHRGYEISQQKRKRVEEPFGWGKTIGGLARPDVARREEARLQVYANDGGLRPHQAATVDRSGGARVTSGLPEGKLPHSKNPNPPPQTDAAPLAPILQQPAMGPRV